MPTTDENNEITTLSEKEDDIMATSTVINGTANQKVERKLLITVAEWDNTTMGGEAKARAILGARVEDSSIEFNPSITTSTDILGTTYTDVDKTEPQQDMDMPLISGSALSAYLSANQLINNINAYNNCFTIYIIAAYMDGSTSSSYYAVKHEGCSVIPTNLGGSDWINMAVEIHYSNKITPGSVDKLADDFEFTPKSA